MLSYKNLRMEYNEFRFVHGFALALFKKKKKSLWIEHCKWFDLFLGTLQLLLGISALFNWVFHPLKITTWHGERRYSTGIHPNTVALLVCNGISWKGHRHNITYQPLGKTALWEQTSNSHLVWNFLRSHCLQFILLTNGHFSSYKWSRVIFKN